MNISSTNELRSSIVSAIRKEIEPIESILAFWEQGSASMARLDELSDIDLQILVQDAHVAVAQRAVEDALRLLGEIELEYVIPLSGFGHWQAFYRLKDYPPTLLVDLTIMKESSSERLLEQEIHGHPIVFFDKGNWIHPVAIERDALYLKLVNRIQQLDTSVKMFQGFVDKELMRQRHTDACHFYLNVILPRLIETLRILYCPFRYNFGLRYLNDDLPADVYQRVVTLCFVSDPDDLKDKNEAAVKWQREVIKELQKRVADRSVFLPIGGGC